MTKNLKTSLAYSCGNSSHHDITVRDSGEELSKIQDAVGEMNKKSKANKSQTSETKCDWSSG